MMSRTKIVTFYVGNVERKDIIDELKTKVPEFMVPKCIYASRRDAAYQER